MAAETRRRSGLPLGGIVFLLVGLMFLLANLDLLPEHITFARWWPVILIAIGFFQLIAARCAFLFSGWLLMLLGATFLLAEQRRFGVTWQNFWRFWPVILILLGFSMLFGRQRRVQHKARPTEQRVETGELYERVVLGGIEKEIVTDDFRGGEIEAVLGSIELDLRRAKMKGEQATLSISAVMGNVEIRIPRDWQAEVQSRSALGAVENQAGSQQDGPHKKMLVIASSVMGHIEIDY